MSDETIIDGASGQTAGAKAHIRTATALQRLTQAGNGVRSVLLFEHGTLQIKMYVPRGANGEKTDSQQPHSRDELYVVAAGSGVFFNGQTRLAAEVGDLIFAPADSEHRFEDFTDDFAVWVMFYGPEGGEGIGKG